MFHDLFHENRLFRHLRGDYTVLKHFIEEKLKTVLFKIVRFKRLGQRHVN